MKNPRKYTDRKALSPDKALKFVRGCVKKKRVVLASDDKGEVNYGYVMKVLEALGHPEALVTDESEVYDFMLGMDEKKEKKWLSALGKRLGVEVQGNDYIWEVAKKIQESEKENRTVT